MELPEEPNNLLKQEVQEPAIYNAIISAIAGGASKLSEIAGKVGEDTSFCSMYIKNLIMLGIVKKEAPYDEDTALFAECKWKNEKVDTSVLETLIEHSNLFHYQNKHFYLFSKSGFTKGCQEKAAEMGNVTLVSYVDMMG